MFAKLFIVGIIIHFGTSEFRKIQYKNYIYLKQHNAFYIKSTNTATIDEASKICETDIAKLYLPLSKTEYEDVWAAVNKEGESIYYAITDREKEGEFVPLDVSRKNNYLIKWHTKEPNNSGDEDCVANEGGKANDIPCTRKFKFICKKDFTYSMVESTVYDYIPEMKKSYKLYLEPKKWHDALVICNNDGAHLSVINNDDEANIAKKYMESGSAILTESITYAFLGFHDIKNEGNFVTVTGQKVNVNMKWENSGKLNSTDENCGAITLAGEITVVSCDRREPFFCEIPDIDYISTPNSFCETFAVKNKDEVYIENPEVNVAYKIHYTPQLWNNARKICRMENGMLALPKNKAEADEILNIFQSKTNDKITNIHAGFHDLFYEGEYVTENGDSLQFYYREWNEDQLDDNFGNKNCGSLNRYGKLEDISCSKLYPFICQKRRTPYRLHKTPRSCCFKDCDYKFYDNFDHAYKLHLIPKPWNIARLVCTSEGGDLAVINNLEERNLFLEILKKSDNKLSRSVKHPNNILLGFHDLFEEGRYTSINGEDLEKSGYFIWNVTEKGYVMENCGSMTTSGFLDDFSCSIPAIFFCEINDWSNKNK